MRVPTYADARIRTPDPLITRASQPVWLIAICGVNRRRRTNCARFAPWRPAVGAGTCGARLVPAPAVEDAGRASSARLCAPAVRSRGPRARAGSYVDHVLPATARGAAAVRAAHRRWPSGRTTNAACRGPQTLVSRSERRLGSSSRTGPFGRHAGINGGSAPLDSRLPTGVYSITTAAARSRRPWLAHT